MNVVDILIAIVVVTILVTIILAVVTYVAYKLRLSREPAPREFDEDETRYFVRYDPPEPEGDEAGGAEGGARVGAGGDSTLERLDRDVAELEGRATEA